MFDTFLIITLFLLSSLLVCLLTLRLSINIKHLCLYFHSLPTLTDFLKFQNSNPPVFKFHKNLRLPPPRPSFIRHLRVNVGKT